MERTIEAEGIRWAVRSLSEEVKRPVEADWHLTRIRFEPLEEEHPPPVRETWLRVEEDVPSRDALDQYGDEELVEAFLAAEEVGEGATE